MNDTAKHVFAFDQGMQGYCGTGDETGIFVATPREAIDYLIEEANDYLDYLDEDAGYDDDTPGTGTGLGDDAMPALRAADREMVESLGAEGSIKRGVAAVALMVAGSYGFDFAAGNRGYGWWLHVAIQDDEYGVCPQCEEPYWLKGKKCDCGYWAGEHFTSHLARFGGEPICVCGAHYCED